MGGSKPQQPQFIQPPPPQFIQAPPPVANQGAAVLQNADDLAQAQLKNNPALVAQGVDLQNKYGPQLAQGQFNQTAQIAPQYRQLLESQYPQLPILSGQVTERLQSPQGLTPQQQAAQDFTRQRASDELSRNIRSQANLGGNLYSGNRQDMETRAQAELQNQYATTDIGLQDQRRQQAISELLSLFQVGGLPVQQTQAAPQFGQGVTPNPDALLQAIQGGMVINPAQLSQGVPGSPGAWPGIAQAGIGAAGMVGAAALL